MEEAPVPTPHIEEPRPAYGTSLADEEQIRIQEKIKEIQERNKSGISSHNEEPWDIKADDPERIHERIFNRISDMAADKAKAEDELRQ